MTNAEIIESERKLHGITEDLHTFQGWQALGRCVKKGEHGIETQLWKLSKKKKAEDEDEENEEEQKSRFYLCKAFLFKESQTEEIVNE